MPEAMELILEIYRPYLATLSMAPIIDIHGVTRIRFVQELYLHIQQAVRRYIINFEYRGSTRHEP